MGYYKTNSPEVMKVWDEMNVANTAMWDQFKEFAALYGNCKPLASKSTPCFSFGGLVFSPPQDTVTWTKPDKRSGTQRPRASVRGQTPDERVAQKAMAKAWDENYPKLRVDLDPLYRSFGTDWGNLFFSGIGYFQGADDFLYVETNVTLAPHMIEILHSEYLAAKKASEVSK